MGKTKEQTNQNISCESPYAPADKQTTHSELANKRTNDILLVLFEGFV